MSVSMPEPFLVSFDSPWYSSAALLPGLTQLGSVVDPPLFLPTPAPILSVALFSRRSGRGGYQLSLLHC